MATATESSAWQEAREISGASYYEHSLTRGAARPALMRDGRADVVVIGAGAAGLNCALELAERGRQVVLLEAARIGSAASGRNGGQVLPGFSCDLDVFQKQGSTAAARTAWDWSLEGMDLVRERAALAADGCEYRSGWMMLAARPGHVKSLRQWYGQLRGPLGYGAFIDYADASGCKAWCQGEDYHGVLIDHRAGHLHPLKLMLALASECERLGVVIHEDSPVQTIVQEGEPEIRTARARLRCRQFVLATNVFIEGLGLSQARRIMSVGNTMLATQALSEELAGELLYHRYAACDTNFMLDYFRITEDRRMLWGGASTYLRHDGSDRLTALRANMLRRFPQLARTPIAYAWGGLIDVTASRAPDFGRLGEHGLYLQGFSGHGLNVTAIGARVAAEALQGDARRFDFFSVLKHRRFPSQRALRRLLLSMGTWYFRLRDQLS